jgi:hypothetical protein
VVCRTESNLFLFFSSSPSSSFLRTRGSLSPGVCCTRSVLCSSGWRIWGVYNPWTRNRLQLTRTPFLPTHHHIEVSSSAWRELQINTTLSDQVHADVAPDMPVTGGAVSFFFFGLANKNAHCQLSIRLHLHWLQQDLQAQWRPIGALPASGFRPYLITCYVQNCSRKSAD